MLQIDLAKRIREVILNGTWIANTNVKELLSDVSVKEATQKVGTLNTIAALTFHIDYYLAGVLQVLKGGELTIKDKYSFDCPELETEEEWSQMLDMLMQNAEEFAATVEQMSDEALDAGFVKAEYGTFRRNIEAIIEHSYYHFGQISLIKKMIRTNFSEAD